MIKNKLSTILNSYDNNDVNYTLSRYIKMHIEDIPYMTIAELAEECYVSQAVITKYCKRFGFDSFKDLKDQCNDYLKEKELILNQIIPENKPIEELTRDCIDNMINQYELFYQRINYSQIELLAKKIIEARCTFLYGKDYFSILSRELQYYLDIYQFPIVLIDEDLLKDYVVKDHSIILIFDKNNYYINNRSYNKYLKHLNTKWFITNANIKEENVILLPEGSKETYHLFIKILVQEVNRQVGISIKEKEI